MAVKTYKLTRLAETMACDMYHEEDLVSGEHTVYLEQSNRMDHVVLSIAPTQDEAIREARAMLSSLRLQSPKPRRVRR